LSVALLAASACAHGYWENLEVEDENLMSKDPDSNRDFAQLTAVNGFRSETHSVTTDDGYILEIWRIPGLVGEETPSEPKPVIFMQHGILDSAYCWIMNYADVAPAF
jgi:hypothetical protein